MNARKWPIVIYIFGAETNKQKKSKNIKDEQIEIETVEWRGSEWRLIENHDCKKKKQTNKPTNVNLSGREVLARERKIVVPHAGVVQFVYRATSAIDLKPDTSIIESGM